MEMAVCRCFQHSYWNPGVFWMAVSKLMQVFEDYMIRSLISGVFLVIDPEREICWILISSIGKAGVSFAQSMLLACLPELWPLPKKQPFMFSVVTWARIWLLSAPFFNVLKKIDTALSLSSYSIMSALGGLCLCFILTPRSSESVAPGETKENNITSVWNTEQKGCENQSFCDENNTRF